MTTGTSHFESLEAAVNYYRPYHYKETRAAVQRKIDAGEIHIGKPTLKPGQRLSIHAEERRYFITE